MTQSMNNYSLIKFAHKNCVNLIYLNRYNIYFYAITTKLLPIITF